MKTVEAVEKYQVAAIHDQLEKNHPEIYADVWRFGCNVGLRISDLLGIQYCDLTNPEELKLNESKTGKHKKVRLNKTAQAVIMARREKYPDDVYLFQVHSNRTKSADPKPVSRVSVARVFKKVGDKLGLHIGSHSMRKSRGKAMFDDGVPVAIIAKTLNHSSEAATLRYLGITEEQVLQTYDDYEL